MNQERGLSSFNVDLIRTVAIVGVILLHAGNDLTSNPTMNSFEILRWSTVDVYLSLGRIGVPLFVMLTGALLLQPQKNESLRVFFKKRWVRLGIPFIFWVSAYLLWDFFVEHQAISSNNIIQGVLTGPYYQFWYLYMLAGLYLLTPILRIVVANAERKVLRYLVIVWFFGVSIVPFISLLTAYNLDANVLTITGWIGYFILGIYLLNVQISRRTLAIFVSLGVALTAIGTYFIAYSVGGGETYFFQEYFSPTMILASVAVFLLLNTFWKPTNPQVTAQKQTDQTVPRQSLGRRFLKVISANTLPIFLFHVMVLDALQRGYFFGFTLNGNTINSIIGVPLVTVLTLAICLAVIVPLKKIPLIKKLIG